MDTYGVGEVWDALGDRTRRSIVLLLAEGPSPVGKLADALPVSRPAVSQHLKVLKDAGLVDEEAEGTRRIYRLNEVGRARACAISSTRSGTGRWAASETSPNNPRRRNEPGR